MLHLRNMNLWVIITDCWHSWWCGGRDCGRLQRDAYRCPWTGSQCSLWLQCLVKLALSFFASFCAAQCPAHNLQPSPKQVCCFFGNLLSIMKIFTQNCRTKALKNLIFFAPLTLQNRHRSSCCLLPYLFGVHWSKWSI